ncbi:MAG: sigma-54-dependent transcriptional regulator [Lysobacterales bacterium]
MSRHVERQGHVLVVEDEPAQRQLMADILSDLGLSVDQAPGQKEAITATRKRAPDLVISDWKLENGDGLSLLKSLRENGLQTSFVMVTAYGSIAHAMEAIRAGADDYLSKPFERQALLLAVERTLRARNLLAENRRLNAEVNERNQLVDIVGKAPGMQKLYRRIEKIAGTQASVLIGGESGTGKELAARAIHTLSNRSDAPFIAVNCGAIPEGLMEAEFLGAEKGAYTGAHQRREGKFEAARGGTLFLDEVGELPITIQPKLLRALQEGRVTRVGGNAEIHTDVRIIAATNKDLAREVAAGQFREDLYYRLNVVPIHMPALRERREDIPALIEHFVTRTLRQHQLTPTPIPAAVRRQLMDYHWPGNVRELGNVVERLILLADDEGISLDDLPQSLADPSRQPDQFVLPPQGINWEQLEARALGQALQRARGNRTKAAKLLGMSYKAFLYRLSKHGLGDDRQ